MLGYHYTTWENWVGIQKEGMCPQWIIEENIRAVTGGITVRYPVNILRIKCVNNYERIHPNQKPIELFEYLIRTYTHEGDLVLDNVIGSGTTALACLRTRRNFIGFEKTKEYFDIACERIANFKGTN